MLNRLEFIRSLLITGLGATLVGACGSDGEPDPQPDANGGGGNVDAGTADAFTGACGTTMVSIGSNHGHALTIPAADLESTSDVTYDIQGGSDHAHSVRITPAQFATLKSTGTLVVTSSTNSGHPHTIRVSCAS